VVFELPCRLVVSNRAYTIKKLNLPQPCVARAWVKSCVILRCCRFEPVLERAIDSGLLVRRSHARTD
jgi:hypothetical protein